MRILAPSKEPSIVVVLNGSEQTIARARLGQYLVLEQLRKAGNIAQYLEASLGAVPASGLEALTAYYQLMVLNQVTLAAPAFKSRTDGGKVDRKDDVWEYPERWVFTWIHLIASRYGWERDTILQLELDEAAGYVQEILISKQLEAEWTYGLSPNAYAYDDVDKVSKFRPMARPSWMTPEAPPVQPVPENLQPPGVTLGYSDLMKQYDS